MPAALQGRGRTDATRRAQTAFSASPRSPPSLLCSHLWLTSRSLTANLAVKWAGEIVGGGTNSWLHCWVHSCFLTSGGLKVLICKIDTLRGDLRSVLEDRGRGCLTGMQGAVLLNKGFL